jgi:hypothetical protein
MGLLLLLQLQLLLELLPLLLELLMLLLGLLLWLPRPLISQMGLPRLLLLQMVVVVVAGIRSY